MRELDAAGLAGRDDPMLRHHVDAAGVTRAWAAGGATVVEHAVAWGDSPPGALALLGLGPAADLDPLLAAVAGAGADPWRLVVEQTSADAVPAAWRFAPSHAWHWMLTRTPPAPDGAAADVEVVEVTGRTAEVDVVLDAVQRTSFVGGASAVETWLGVEGPDGGLLAVGALVRRPDGTGQLRGITTLPGHTGRGLATAVSAALTRRALEHGTGVATLGVFTDNGRAVRVYERLGYRVGHTLVAGRTGEPSA
ncbi:hypothetical protein GCM10023340_30120 [Nocardioides marinquilinus]|uniref:N-acetyltransferase domain-containing protein n=1 Tax=Nocardioides marinquilinus TaxID=1210400 RepID=A0ABP9PWI2_9ACTN